MTKSDTPGTGDFWTFEHTGWESVALAYHRSFRDLTRQAIGPLFQAAGVRPGARVLDVASGPGYVAAAAAGRGALVKGVDFSEVMVATASGLHPGVDYRHGDAEALPFDDGTFDAVVMNFGLLHLGRPEQATAEACRVLVGGGRFAFTVWAHPDEAVVFGAVLQAVKAHGNPSVVLPPGPPFFRFSDFAQCRQVLLDSGFQEPIVERIPLVWVLPSSDAAFEAMERSTVRTAALLRAQSPAAKAAIGAAVKEALRPYEARGHLELPMPAVLAWATKPVRSQPAPTCQ